MGKLFIICGHGNGDPGATGNGYEEAERVRALAKRIKHFGGDSVTIGNTARKWSTENLVNNSNIPKGSLVLELHMDSSTSKSAKGGHIIIKKGLDADKYDKALAKFISDVFPGRSITISKRDDLANPNRAAKAGINYRLMECGFISNAGDVKIFNSKMDENAKGILKCFGITPKSEDKKEEKPVSKPVTTSSYYKKCKKNEDSLVDGLKDVGVKPTFTNRKKIAKKNGIKVYTGTAKQNTKLLDLLKAGKLKKA